MDKITQSQRVLMYLREHKSITPLEALTQFGIMRLGARVYDLKREGYDIKTEMVTAIARDGSKTKVAAYSLGVE